MEIIILLGLSGSGKTTILNNINNDGILKLSLDEFDKNTRTNNKRINIIFQLFQEFLKINIDFQKFLIDYLDNFNLQNNSLLNTLSILYSKYSLNSVNEDIKNELRKKI
jgi:dephospho-CoA kinase